MPTIFSPEQTKRIVDRVITPEIQGEHRFAIVGAVDQAGTQVVARFTRKRNGWELDGNAVWEHDWSGENRIGARLLATF